MMTLLMSSGGDIILVKTGFRSKILSLFHKILLTFTKSKDIVAPEIVFTRRGMPVFRKFLYWAKDKSVVASILFMTNVRRALLFLTRRKGCHPRRMMASEFLKAHGYRVLQGRRL